METTTLLRANIKHKKGAFISVMILTALIVTTAAAVMGVRMNYRSARERACEEADVATSTVFIAERLLDDELLDKVRGSSLVERIKVNDAIVNTGKAVFPNYSDGNSYFFCLMRGGMKLYNSTYDGFEDSIPEPGKGEIYLPFGLHSKMDAKIGDPVKVNFAGTDREFTVKGFLQEPTQGGAMIGWNQVFISKEDYDEIHSFVEPTESDTSTKLFKILNVFKADRELSDKKFQRQLNLETGIISRSVGSLTREDSDKYTGLFMDIVLDVVLGFVGLLFVIVLVIIAHSIRTEIEMDYVNLGILKAQGFTDGKISKVILLRYFFAEAFGVVIGIIASIPIERMLSGVFRGVTAILPDKSIAVGSTAVIVLGVFLLSALIILLCTRRLARISPVRAISGGRKEIYFSSRFTAPVTKRGLTASIAYRSFTSSFGKYIGILFITALLTFFAVTVNVMSAAVNSRQALETMGMYYEDISIRINDTAGHGHIEDYEKTVEKYSHIEKKYYVTGLYLSLNGESVMCEVWDEIKYLPGLLKGRLPIYENEVMITGSVADTLDLKMGDRVTMAGKKQEAEYIVSGIYQTGNDAGYCTAMSLEAAKRIGIKNVSNLGMVLTDTSELEKIAEELNSEYGNMITASANRFEKDITNDTLMTSARAIRFMIYAFSGVFALVAVIMVCSKAFSQERTDLGIYKAMGFTSGRLRRQFAVRFLIISLIGSVVGAAAGALFSVDILNLVFSLFGISRVQSDSTPLTFIMAAAFVCLSTAVFAYLTSRRIKKIEVRELVTE
ncbi:ABC-type transport system, involved in lipoprotein release, permease component [Ruminococcaceae bacterium FB2012]|nr:ABC-type transport system, involved in lipoprotein release, permease component [Ruminococcaceae bacterium FB2012]